MEVNTKYKNGKYTCYGKLKGYDYSFESEKLGEAWEKMEKQIESLSIDASHINWTPTKYY